MDVNRRAAAVADLLAADPARFGVAVHDVAGARVVDAGVQAPGGVEAGLLVARVCLADLGTVSLVPGRWGVWAGPAVQVATDRPLWACMASQYAGWPISVGNWFAMGSGPMRAVRGKEPLFAEFDLHDPAAAAVGVLEAGKLPDAAAVQAIAEELRLSPTNITLLVARTASLAGGVQVVARSVETAMHKLHTLGFDLRLVASGVGVAPLPPPAANDLAAIGRTNDAVLYGGSVHLWLRADDAAIAAVGPRLPSSASPDHGRPFADLFERAGRDFYKLDPLLFSPAVVTLSSLLTGRTQRFGAFDDELVARSLAGL